MNHVTAKTALILADLGFPQPKPQFGQIWWYAESENHPFREVLVTTEGYRPPTSIFAPTATDILLQLPDRYALCRVNQDMFLVSTGLRLPAMGDKGCTTNPAEGLALAWIELQNKKQ